MSLVLYRDFFALLALFAFFLKWYQLRFILGVQCCLKNQAARRIAISPDHFTVLSTILTGGAKGWPRNSVCSPGGVEGTYKSFWLSCVSYSLFLWQMIVHKCQCQEDWAVFLFLFQSKIGKWEKKASTAFDSAFEIFWVPCKGHTC